MVFLNSIGLLARFNRDGLVGHDSILVTLAFFVLDVLLLVHVGEVFRRSSNLILGLSIFQCVQRVLFDAINRESRGVLDEDIRDRVNSKAANVSEAF